MLTRINNRFFRRWKYLEFQSFSFDSLRFNDFFLISLCLSNCHKLMSQIVDNLMLHGNYVPI